MEARGCKELPVAGSLQRCSAEAYGTSEETRTRPSTTYYRCSQLVGIVGFRYVGGLGERDEMDQDRCRSMQDRGDFNSVGFAWKRIERSGTETNFERIKQGICLQVQLRVEQYEARSKLSITLRFPPTPACHRLVHHLRHR